MLISVIELLGLLGLLVTPVWFFGGLTWALCMAVLVLLGVVLVQIWKAERLELWLSRPNWRDELAWGGVWGEIVQRIQRQLRQHDKQLRTSEQRLQYFLQAIQASPNGLTLLDN